MRFLGSTEAKIDVKGRAFLPAGFRKVLGTFGTDSLILRKDVFQDCLVLYPECVWNEMLDCLRQKLNRWNKRDQMVYRQFVSDVEMITLDGNGRFLIPKRYIKMAHIEQGIRFIGMDDCIELWSTDNPSRFLNADDFSKAMEDTMGKTIGADNETTKTNRAE